LAELGVGLSHEPGFHQVSFDYLRCWWCTIFYWFKILNLCIDHKHVMILFLKIISFWNVGDVIRL
jgi:hypothetical protein